MSRPIRLLFAVIGGMLALLFAFAPAGDGPGAPRVVPGETAEVAAPAPAPTAGRLLADGTAVTMVDAYVVGRGGKAARGVPVLFHTSAGSITPCAWTDDGGRVSVPFCPAYSPEETNAVITAAVPAETDSIVQVALFEPPASAAPDWHDARIALLRTGGPGTTALVAEDLVQLSVAATETSERIVEPLGGVAVRLEGADGPVPADGVSRAALRAVVSERESGAPVEGVEVVFHGPGGAVLASAVTDGRGVAEQGITSPATPGRVAVEAAVGGTGAASAELLFTPVTLAIASAPGELDADGASVGEVEAVLRGADGRPLPWVPVRFSTSAGTITSPVVTDDEGRAVARLTSGVRAAAATVTAAHEGGAADTAVVRFTRRFLPAAIALSAEPREIPADGETASFLRAAVFDSAGDPVDDGTPVLFRVVRGEGTVEPMAVTERGVATARFLGTSPSPATVRALACGAAEEADITLRLGGGGLVQVGAEPTVLAGNGEDRANVTVALYDNRGAPLGPGEEVRLRASRGTIAEKAVTGPDGTVEVPYTADIGAGPAWITAAAGREGLESEGHARIRLEAGPAAAVELEAVSAPRINVQGAAPPFFATLLFTVTDANGVPVDSSGRSTVRFEIVESPGAGERLSSTSAVTDGSGRVIASLESGRAPGRVELVALLETGGAVVRSAPAEVTIGGFRSRPSKIVLEPSRLNLPGLCFKERDLTVSALVLDQLGKPVPAGTTVYFSSDFGSIEGAVTTNAVGRAIARFVSSRPHPVSTHGLVTIAASVPSPADPVTAGTSIVLSGCTRPVETTPAEFAVPDGGSQLFTFRIGDANGNPLAAGTEVEIVASAGSLAGDLSFVLPDELAGHTDYSFYLADEIPGDDDEPASAFVTILVTSPNGDLTTTVRGTID